MNPKQRYFDICKKLAVKSDHVHHKLGSVLVKKGRIISLGWNKMRTHTKSLHRFRALHAEMDTIIGVDRKDLQGSILYVWRGKKNGDAGISRPCDACQQMIKFAGIRGVFYSIDTYPFWKFEEFK